MRRVSADEIESLAIGAWILGTGGGGSPYLALLNMRQLYREGVVCQLMDASELADDEMVAVVSNMGAPLVGQERLTDPKTMARAVTMMEEYLGQKFRAVMSLEIGGGNSIQPFMAAAILDLPVVDGDCMGRAFPEAQMTSFAIHDLRMYPLTLADIPRSWEPFWSFWCDKVQPAVRKATGRDDVYGVGLPMSVGADDDTEDAFRQFVEAYGANYVTRDGRLVIYEPGMRDRLLRALDADPRRRPTDGRTDPGAAGRSRCRDSARGERGVRARPPRARKGLRADRVRRGAAQLLRPQAGGVRRSVRRCVATCTLLHRAVRVMNAHTRLLQEAA